MKLYEIPRESKIYEPVNDGSEYFIFNKLDGMYSVCTSEKGGLCHLGASQELEPYKDGYKFATVIEKTDKCEHDVIGKYCFNCKLKAKHGMKVEMFDNHHYVRLRDAEKALEKQKEMLLSAFDKLVWKHTARIQKGALLDISEGIEVLRNNQ